MSKPLHKLGATPLFMLNNLFKSKTQFFLTSALSCCCSYKYHSEQHQRYPKVEGYATKEGTKRFHDRFVNADISNKHIRNIDLNNEQLTVPPIALSTYSFTPNYWQPKDDDKHIDHVYAFI